MQTGFVTASTSWLPSFLGMGQTSRGRGRSLMVWKFCGSINNGDLLLQLSSGDLRLEARMSPGKWTDEGSPHRTVTGVWPFQARGQFPASATHRFRTGLTGEIRQPVSEENLFPTEQFKLACDPYTPLVCTSQIKNFYSFFDLQIILTDNCYWVLLHARHLIRRLS